MRIPLCICILDRKALKRVEKELLEQSKLQYMVSIPVMGSSGGMAHMAGLCIFLILPSTSSTASLPFRACNS